ncbi:MAG: acyl-CoA synthetase [Spirosomataceae bacterium]
MLKLLKNATTWRDKCAIVSDNKSFSYQTLLDASYEFAALLLDNADDLHESRVAFMIAPGFDYVCVQWGIWRAGGIAVPLCITYPLPSLQYVIEDTQAEIIVVGPEYAQLLDTLAQKKLRLIVWRGERPLKTTNRKLPSIRPQRKAMILYTSGTTNLPKGVVTTHATIEAQMATLVKSWQWSDKDHILCVLPLHHVHGIINVVGCALWSGASVTFLPSFSADAVFKTFLEGNINVFMAVPTIYFKLIAYWENLDIQQQTQISATLSNFRLMVSGSAALPVSVMEKWKNISGHTLLERYGMTEIGMAISNPYHGERRAGYIGKPLPGVKVRLVDEQNTVVAKGQPGEIQVQGKNVFLAYWQKPEATQKAFTEDGWFKTGDIAVIEKNYYRILGRDSIDIIKSGGYKISALEIEEVLRTYPAVKDCSVVGIPDEEWGELVVAALVVNDKNIDENALTTWMREKMPAYKTPRQYKIVGELPRNAMGKVTKNDVKKYF